MERLREKLSYLFPAPASPAVTVGEVIANAVGSGTEERVDRLAFSAVTLLHASSVAAITTEDFASDTVIAFLDRHLLDPTFEHLLDLQILLVTEGAVRMDRVFGLAARHPPSPAPFRREYIRLLQELRAALERQSQAPGGGLPTLAEASRGLLGFLADNFRADLVELLAPPGVEGLLVRRLGSDLAEPAAGLSGMAPGVHLLGADGSRALPVAPFVRVRADSVLCFLGIGNSGVLYWDPVDGTTCTVIDQPSMAGAAELCLRTGLYRKAMSLYRFIGEGLGQRYDYRSALHGSHAQLAARHQSEGKVALAVSELESAVRYRPDIPLAYYGLARLYGRQGQVDKAVTLLRRLVEGQPQLDRAHELVGDLCREKGDADSALRMFGRALLINPWSRSAELKRARTAEELRKARGREVAAPTAAPPEAAPKPAEKAPEKKLVEEMLTDMIAEARRGAFAPLSGRERELRQMVEILACRKKKNVLLIGDAGVGKTAIVEELARRVAAGHVPRHLRGKRLYLMNVATLLAGAKFRGQFEERVLDLLKELQAVDGLLFIDDFHTIVNAGLTKGGTLDTSNLLKPSLIRGDIQSIGATTFDEYRQNIEKDPSLARCYQLVRVEEPDAAQTRDILRGVTRRLEEYHKVRFAQDAAADTLDLIRMCLRERALPDKAIDVLDRAAARVALRAQEGHEAPAIVEQDDIVGTLSDLTGIPAERLNGRRTDKLQRLDEILKARVCGQVEAVQRVARVLRAAKLNLALRAQRPDGVFLFVGPTGVGKTELARALAETLFGDEDKLIRIDMSEYMEKISTSRLIGAAPGYVGYNDQNQLTDLVRKNPYSLVLLDEIEKADAMTMNLFLQVFDAGRLTDGKGRTVHFGNTVIVMTSNVGTRLYSRGPVGYEGGVGQEEEDRPRVTRSQLMKEIKRFFSPEFLNRIDEIVFFEPLSPAAVRDVSRLQFRELAQRLEREGKTLSISEAAASRCAREGYDPENGARNLARTIRRLVLEPLAARVLCLEPEEWRCVRHIAIDAGVEDGPSVPFAIELEADAGAAEERITEPGGLMLDLLEDDADSS